MRASRALVASALLAGCNAILGIEEPERAPMDGGVDGGGTDGTVPDVVGTADGSVIDPDGGDGGDGATPDGDGSSADADGGSLFTCDPLSAASLKLFSEKVTSPGPALAFHAPDLWGAAWQKPGGEIRYNAFTTAGAPQFDGGLLLLGPGQHGDVSIESTTDGFGVSLGRYDAGIFATLIRVGTTGAISSPINSPKYIDASSATYPTVELATRGDSVAVVTRDYHQTNQTAAKTQVVSASFSDPADIANNTRAVAVSWLDDANYAVAYVSSAPKQGTFLKFNVTTDPPTLMQTVPFAVNGVRTEATNMYVSVAGVGSGDVVIATVGTNIAAAEIDLTLISNGAVMTTEVASLATPNEKVAPRVIYDGKHIIVAWLEFASGTYTLSFRRYTPALVPLEAEPRTVTTGGVVVSHEEFGLAASTVNNTYGLAFRGADHGRYFGVVTCNGP